MLVSHYLATLPSSFVGLLVPRARLMPKFFYERILVTNCDLVLIENFNLLTRPVFFIPRTNVAYLKQHMQNLLPEKYAKKLRYPSGEFVSRNRFVESFFVSMTQHSRPSNEIDYSQRRTSGCQAVSSHLVERVALTRALPP